MLTPSSFDSGVYFKIKGLTSQENFFLLEQTPKAFLTELPSSQMDLTILFIYFIF